MSRSERMRRLSRLVPWPAVLLAAACGGDKGPAGPGGGEGAASYELVSLGRVGLPADLQVEDCSETRFYAGELDVDENGDWQISLQVHDFSGDWGYLDEGESTEDDGTVWFDSDVSGSTYRGTVAGSEVTITYDWCYDGTPDVQLVFDR